MIARRVKPILWAALATAALGTGASATTLGNGGSSIGTVIPPDAGTIIATTGILPFNTNTANPLLGVTGHYLEDVLRRSSDNELDFILKAEVDASNADTLDRITLTPFTIFTTDVGFDPTNATTGIPGTVAPIFMNRSPGGNVVGFSFGPGFGPGVLPGANTFDLIIKTNAMSYQVGNLGFIDGGASTETGFAPVAPEPGSLALLATGGLPLLGFLRRRKLA
jgi:hypothetical protein